MESEQYYEAMQRTNEMLGLEGFWMVSKPVARKTGLPEAILFTDLVSKHKYYKRIDQCEDGEWFYNTRETIKKDTTIPVRSQTRYIDKLKKMGLILTKTKKGIPAKTYYKINYQNFLKMMASQSCQK